MTYTTNISNQKYFLNDKNIAQQLDGDVVQFNAVPSLDLLNEVNNALTAYDTNLCAYLDNLNEQYEYDIKSPYLSVITRIEQIKGQLTGIETVELLSSHVKNLKEFVEDTIDSLDVSTLSATNQFVRTLTEIDGKIQATFSKVLSSDIDGQLQQTQIQNLTADLDSCFKKSGGLINGNTQVNGVLSVSGKSIVESDSNIHGNLVQGRGTTSIGDAMHSVVMGISASTNKDNVFLWNGKQNEAYTDHGYGTFNINAVSGVNGVFVGSQSLEQIVDNKRETARLQAKDYTDSVSTTLSTDYVSKIATAKAEAIETAKTNATNYSNSVSTALSTDYVNKIEIAKSEAIETAKINATAYSNSVSTTLSTDYVSKIATAKSEAILTAAADASNKVSALDTKLSTVAVLVSSDLGFDYDEASRMIRLNIKDYTGHDHTFTIDSARFIKGRIVDHVNIVEIDGQQVLRIWWTVEEGGTGVFSDVPLAALAQVYTQGEGIKIVLQENGGYVISVDDTIVNKTLLNEKVSEINATTTALDRRLENDEAFIYGTLSNELYNDTKPRISALEIGLNTANSNIQNNAASITDSNNHIQSLEAYATSLSAPNGQIQTLSNAITANYDYAHDKLSSRIAIDEAKISDVSAHANRLQEYVNSLSVPNGQIQTLSNAITANDAKIALNAGDINALVNHTNDLQTYANELSSYGGTIDTIHNDIKQLSTSIIDSDSFIGEIKVNYNNLTAGTDQAWISQHGNTLSGILQHFTLAPLGYVKQNTIVKVTYTNVPANAGRTEFATLKYVTDDGIVFTDNDYIIIHGEFDKVNLEDITPAHIHYINAVKRNELFDLSNTVYDNYVWLSGDNISFNGHAISGTNEFTGQLVVGKNLYVGKGNYGYDKTLTGCVNGDGAFAHGIDCCAYNQGAYAGGVSCYSSGDSAHSEGYACTADGDNSHAEGYNTTALCANSHAAGNNTIANSENQFVVGKYNEINSNALFIVGNGENSSNKSNAFVVDIDGNVSANRNIDAQMLYLHETFAIQDLLTASNNVDTGFGITVNNASIVGLLSGTNPTNAATYGQVNKKIWIDDRISDTIQEKFSDLSIIKLTEEEYNSMAVNSKLVENTLYVVESDYVDMYGQEIRNVLSSVNPTNAATYGQLLKAEADAEKYTDDKCNSLSNKVSSNYLETSAGTSKLSASMLSALSASMYSALSTSILNAIYPVGSIYIDNNTPSAATCPIQSALGGTWTRNDSDTIQITKNGTATVVPVWTRTAL